MNVYHALLVGCVVGLGTLTSLTDLRHGKIYNRHLLSFILFGLAVHGWALTTLPQAPAEIVQILINSVAGFSLACFLYVVRVWTAGDAKLFSTFLFLIPMVFYRQAPQNVFPGFAILMNIFAAAFLAVAIISIPQPRATGHWSTPHRIRSWVQPWVIGMPAVGVLIILNLPIMRWIAWLGVYDRLALSLVEAAVGSWVVSKIQSRFIKTSLALAGLTLVLVLGNARANLAVVALSLVFVAMREFLKSAQVTQTPIRDFRPGMALSIEALFALRMGTRSPIDLPPPGRRLDVKAVEKVQALAIQQGISVLGTVRVIPFAPYIFVGVILQLIFRGYFLG